MKINIFYGDHQRLDLHSSLFCLKEECENFSFYDLNLEDILKYDSDDIFDDTKKNIVCKVRNDIKFNNIPTFNKNIFIYFYGDKKINKNSKLFKSFKSLKELKSINNGFGGINEKEFIDVKKDVINYLTNNIEYSNYINDIEVFINYLLRHSYYGGMINDIQSWVDILKTYNETVYLNEDMNSLTDPNLEDEAMSILGHIQELNVEKIFYYFRNTTIDYVSLIVILQSFYHTLSRVLTAYQSVGYRIDMDNVSEKVPGVNKYGIYKGIKYMNQMGADRICYIYNYLNYSLAKECVSDFTYSRDIKMMNLSRLVCGYDVMHYKEQYET